MAWCAIGKFLWLFILQIHLQRMQCSSLCPNNVSDGKSCKKSEIISMPGHWPESFCIITNIVFHVSDSTISIVKEDTKDLGKCFKIQDVWSFRATQEDVNNLVCDQVFCSGHFFTVYYFYGSNYFHLHYDTLIPLYAALNYQQNEVSKDSVLLPAVEIKRGEGIDWETDAFMKPEAYWWDMLLAVAGSRRILPLDKRLAAINKTMCFEKAYFGTPKVQYSDSTLIRDYIQYIKKTLKIEETVANIEKPKVGIIHRERCRKILNEEELIKSIESFADGEIVDFSELSFKQQVQKVQEYNILAGINGAGLANALYLPNNSVAIQLVPYKAQLNVEEFAALLKARGPYLEWHNTHSNLNYPAKTDPFNNGSDTVVHPQEFAQIIREALKMQQAYAD